MKTLKERVEFLLRLRDTTQAEASRRGGLNTAFINDVLRGVKQSVRGANLAKLALAFQTTSDFLLGNTDNPDLPGEASDRVEISGAAQDFVKAAYGGVVEAGAFREVGDFADEDLIRETLLEPRDPDFPQASLVYFTVAGDSMNALRPRPILPGDRVIGLDFESLGGRILPKDGLTVVVEQTLQGGHHRERSVKQIELHQDRIEFHPRSTNAKHKAIVVPIKSFLDASEQDDRTVRILAVVRRVSNEIPL